SYALCRPALHSPSSPYTTLFRSRYIRALSRLLVPSRFLPDSKLEPTSCSNQDTPMDDDMLDLRGLKCPLPALLAKKALAPLPARWEEHTSELQSRENLVCRLLLD